VFVSHGEVVKKSVAILENNIAVLAKCEARCERNGELLVAIAQSLTLGEGLLAFIDAVLALRQFFLVSRGR
jgi:hypothetical protein